MLNYRHLYYFWIVVKEGGFARAAGRGVAMTEAGEQAFDRAEQIFQLGEALLDEMREASGADSVRLAVGLSDGISKLAAHALLAPVLATPSLRLLCHEGEPAQLLSELALARPRGRRHRGDSRNPLATRPASCARVAGDRGGAVVRASHCRGAPRLRRARSERVTHAHRHRHPRIRRRRRQRVESRVRQHRIARRALRVRKAEAVRAVVREVAGLC
ncbi:DNA-binding transcriptional LysR family regulator [Paraburkholderia sp. CI2]|uniref:hypothetical protein n=1 Tax=Paraburkholderia sp. CI2 TaxID=2723093 RepID=UPI00180A443B|nr:hypothetical protein [Paraburkholderia sp. CI2]MBB5464517.1 DNA-binding transcriptional LysR family regulator [Paraburkholderia sp. CI2]